MEEDFEALCGITKEELLTVFAEPIQELAQKWNITEDEVENKLKRQYDGYHFSENLLGDYNPFSLLNRFR